MLFVVNFGLKLLINRFSGISRLLQGEEIMLIYNGVVNRKNIRRARLSMEEIGEAVREHGVSGIGDVDLAVLEVDGNISVLSGNFTRRTVEKRNARKGRGKRT
jgi:Predicted membrane protein